MGQASRKTSASNKNKKINPRNFEAVSTLLHEAVEDGVFPGAVLLVSQFGQLAHRVAVGNKWLNGKPADCDNEMRGDTVFDIGTATASLATVVVIMKLVGQGRLLVDDKVARYLQSFAVLGKGGISVANLLNHTSGLPATLPFYEELARKNLADRIGILTSRGAKDFVFSSIHRLPLKYSVGTRQVFSDLGLMLLGQIIETLTGLTLDRAVHKYVLDPLGLKSTSFVDLTLIKRRGLSPVVEMIAPTEDCVWRKRVLCGEVQDENAWAMGGVAGHAGLFSTARDLHVIVKELMQSYQGKSNFVPGHILRYFWGPASGDFAGSGWRLGWDSPSRENGLDDVGFSEVAVGVNGSTGCSIWIDPARDAHIILMSNRVHPYRSNRKINSFRSLLFSKIFESLYSSN